MRSLAIFYDDQIVARLQEGAGVVTSLSAPPPAPDTNPEVCLYAAIVFLDPVHEGELGQLLRSARSLDEFLSMVALHRFVTKNQEPPQA